MKKEESWRTSFSENAVKKAVLTETASHPLSVYPVVLALLGGLAGLLFGSSTFLLLGASGAMSIGLASWLVNYYGRRQTFAGRYLRKAHVALEEQSRKRLTELQSELEDLGLEQGVEQIKKFGEKLENLKALLRRKLNERELTYGRYLGIAEQVYLSAIDNLHEAAGALRSVSTIDPQYIDGRIEELMEIGGSEEKHRPEIKSLEDRKDLLREQHRRVAELIAQNETAMTHLDTTAAAIAGMKTTPEHASMDLETAMEELARLAGRAKQY